MVKPAGANSIAPWWGGAFDHLQDALACINAGGSGCENAEEIWLGAGVHFADDGSGRVQGDATESFVLPAGIGVYGGFDGFECQRRERDPQANVTVLSGDIDDDDDKDPNGVTLNYLDINGSNSDHLVEVPGVDSGQAAVRIDGVTLTAGSTNTRGGAIRCEAQASERCAMALVDVELIGNQAPTPGTDPSNFPAGTNHGGGAVYAENGDLWFERMTFMGNHAWGGASLMMEGGTLDGEAVVIRANDAQWGNVTLRNVEVNLGDLEVAENTARFASGFAVEGVDARVSVDGGSCHDNVTSLAGGACFTFNQLGFLGPENYDVNPLSEGDDYWRDRPRALEVHNYVVRDNVFSGGTGTGAIFAHYASISLDAVEFVGNAAQLQGNMGDIYRRAVLTLEYGDLEVRDSLFEGNTGGYAAVLFLASTDVAIDGATFIQNATTNTANYLNIVMSYAWSRAAHTQVIKNSTFEGNAGAGVMRVTDTEDTLIVNTRFVGNLPKSRGAIETSANGQFRVENCEFVGNDATAGPAVLRSTNTDRLLMLQSSFVDNTTGDPDAGVIYLTRGSASMNPVVEVYNSIFSDPSAPAEIYGVDPCLAGTTVDCSTTPKAADLSISHSVVEGGENSISGSGPDDFTLDYDSSNVDADPQFLDVAGPDATLGTADDSLALASTSPAIDLGSATQLSPDDADLDGDLDTVEFLPVDILGHPRVSGANPDAGAREWGAGR